MRATPLVLISLLFVSCPEPELYNAPDSDGDGWSDELDCDDTDAAVYPGADELCDELDNDCDDAIDESPVDADTWYGDSDGDGHGGDTFVELGCTRPDGFVALSDDCNDLDPGTYPGAEESCDGADNDCDGEVDEEDAVDAWDWYFDGDGDGWGVSDDVATACEAPRDYVAHDGDCDDADPA